MGPFFGDVQGLAGGTALIWGIAACWKSPRPANIPGHRRVQAKKKRGFFQDSFDWLAPIFAQMTCTVERGYTGRNKEETARTAKGETTENTKRPEPQVKGKLRLISARIPHTPK